MGSLSAETSDPTPMLMAMATAISASVVVVRSRDLTAMTTSATAPTTMARI